MHLRKLARREVEFISHAWLGGELLHKYIEQPTSSHRITNNQNASFKPAQGTLKYWSEQLTHLRKLTTNWFSYEPSSGGELLCTYIEQQPQPLLHYKQNKLFLPQAPHFPASIWRITAVFITLNLQIKTTHLRKSSTNWFTSRNREESYSIHWRSTTS